MPNHLRKDTEKGARVINEECFVEALWIAFQPCHASTYLRCQINEVYLHTYEIDTSILDPPMHFLMDAIHRLWNQFTEDTVYCDESVSKQGHRNRNEDN